MKKFFEKLDDKGRMDRYWEIELDDYSLEVKTRYGQNAYWRSSDFIKGGRTSAKTFPNLEKAQKDFDKKIATKLKGGYEASDIKYPLTVKNQIETAKVNKTKSIDITAFSDICLEKVCELTHLEDLKIQLTNLDAMDIPAEIGKLKNLTSLHFCYGEIQSVPPEIGNLTKLKQLYFAGTKMKILPSEIGKLKNLVELHIGSNQFGFLPIELGNLSKLEKLNISDNNLSTLPNSIGKLKKLTELHLSSNPFTSLPDEIKNLKKITSLDFRSSSMQQIPTAVCLMENLIELTVVNCNLQSIPPAIKNLKKLQNLNIASWYGNANNQVSSLPDELFELKELRTLNLSNNNLSSISEKITQLTNLSNLQISGNPIKGVEAKVLNSRTPDTFYEAMAWAKVDEGDAIDQYVTQAEIDQIRIDYSDRINVLAKEMKQRCYNLPTFPDNFLAFLRFETHVKPKITSNDFFILHDLEKILAPYKEWTAMEERILIYITDGNWQIDHYNQYSKRKSKIGLYNIFTNWYSEQIRNEVEPPLKEMLDLLEAKGCDREIARKLIFNDVDDLINHNNRRTTFVDFIIEKFDANPKAFMASLSKSFESERPIIIALITHHSKAFHPYLESYIFDAHLDKKGNLLKKGQAINYNEFILRALFKADSKKYEALIVKAAKTTNDVNGYGSMAMLLNKYEGDKHKKLIAELLSKIANHETALDRQGAFRLKMVPELRHWNYETGLALWAIRVLGNDSKDIVSVVEEKCRPNIEILTYYVDQFGESVLDTAYEYLYQHPLHQSKKLLSFIAKYDHSAHYDRLWELLIDPKVKSANLTGTYAAHIYSVLGEKTIAKATELLNGKTVGQRWGAVNLLKAINTPKTQKLLSTIIDTETNDEIRNYLVNYLYTFEGTIDKKEAMRRVNIADKRGKLAKVSKTWLKEDKLPKLYWNDGKKVDDKTIRYLIYTQKDRGLEVNPESAAIYDLIDENKSGDFAFGLFEQVEANGGLYAKNKAFYIPIAKFGDERLHKPLKKMCIDKNSPTPVAVLGHQKTLETARVLDAIIKHFKTKYPNVREAANAGLERIADKMGLTKQGLMDEMIPDFGFENLFKEFEVNGETHRAFIGLDLKVQFLDELDNIKKTISSKADKTVKAEFKEVNKGIRSLSKGLKQTMENNMVLQRRWSKEDWWKFFMEKPLPNAMGQSMVWGVYKDLKQVAQFMVTQDQVLEDFEFEEVTVADDQKVGLVHPMEMTAEQLTSWQSYLEDNKITQLFSQLERPVHKSTKDDLSKTMSERFSGNKVGVATFKSRAEKRSWRRGSVQDAGMVEGYKKTFETAGIEAYIRLEDMNVVIYDYDEKCTFEEMMFVKQGTVSTGSYVYDMPYKKDDKRLIVIKDVPPIVYSEVVADLIAIAGEQKTES